MAGSFSRRRKPAFPGSRPEGKIFLSPTHAATATLLFRILRLLTGRAQQTSLARCLEPGEKEDGPARNKNRNASLRHRRTELSQADLGQATHLCLRSAAGRAEIHQSAGAASRSDLRRTSARQELFAGPPGLRAGEASD